MNELEIITNAKTHIEREPDLAVYMCRDLQVTYKAGLYDLAWALSQGSCHKNDAIGFFEYLDEYINNQQKETQCQR